MPVVATMCLPHLDVDAEGLQPLGGRPAGGGPAGGIPAGGTLAEEGPAEEGPAGEGPADLLERSPSREPVAWSPRRLWNLLAVVAALASAWGEAAFSLPGGGQVATDGPSRRRKSIEPPSPLAVIPRLDGDPSPPHDRSNCLHCKGVPRPASFVLSAAVAHSSAVAYLLSHTCGRRAQPRWKRIPAREAHVRGRGNPRLRTARRPGTEPPAPALTSGVDGCFRVG
jgi:hypothetical protein